MKSILLLLTVMASAPPPAVAADSLTIARLRYEGGGDWYANPSSLPNLLSALRERAGLVTTRREATVAPLDPALFVFPDAELTEIPPDHPVFHVFYDFEDGLPKIHEHDGKPPQAFGIFLGGRMLVFYSYESDLGDGWEDEGVHEDEAPTRESALRMGINLFLFALGQSVS
jgi:hypothetical protein